MACDNTGALTEQDIDDISVNVKAVNEWAEGDETAVATMANGRAVPSPSKVIFDARLYKPALAWPGAGIVTDASQAYLGGDDVLYAANPALLPLAVSGTFVTDIAVANAWYVVVHRSNVRTFNSIADLPTNALDGAEVSIVGFYSIVPNILPDGGGGSFVWDASGDALDHNGGTIIDPNHSGVPGDATWWTPEAGTGVWRRKFTGSLNVRFYGAKGDAVNDDHPPSQAASNSLPTGGVLFFQDGIYRFTQPLTPASNEVPGLYIVGESQDNTLIEADHNAGAGVKLNRSNSGIRDITIRGSATRKAGAAGVNYGLHIEPVDIAGKAIANIRVVNVKSFDHPSHGMMVVGNCQLSYFENVQTTGNLGHGAWFHEGTATGRVNVSSPGIVTMINHWSITNGGHSLVLGDPSDTISEGPFRFTMLNPEYGLSATDAAVRHTTDQVWVRGTAINVIGAATIALGTTGGWRIAGKNHQYINTRWISTTYSFNIEPDDVSGVTVGVNIDGLGVINTAHDPSVVISDLTKVTQIDVKSYVRDNLTTLITPGARRSSTRVLGPDVVNLIKTTTDIVNNSTTLVDDGELSFGLDEDEFLSFKLRLRYSGDASADFKVGVSVPAGVTVRWGPVNGITVNTADAIAVVNEKTESGTFSLGTATSSRWIELVGFISTGANSGDFKVQFAQVTAVATNTSLLSGSALEINRRNQI